MVEVIVVVEKIKNGFWAYIAKVDTLVMGCLPQLARALAQAMRLYPGRMYATVNILRTQ